MPRQSRKEEIIKAIRDYLLTAVNRLEQITDERLIEAAGCARATFYKYVTAGSEIEGEIEIARRKQKEYAKAAREDKAGIENEPGLRKRLMEAEEGNRKLLALFAQLIANLIQSGVSVNVIQAAQRDAMPHPNRSFSHAGKGRCRY